MANKTFLPLTDFIPGPIEKMILVKGNFVMCKSKDGESRWLHIGKYCTIHEFEENIIINPEEYQVCFYESSKAYVIVDKMYTPFNKNLPEIGRRIHLTIRNGMYEVTRHANGMFAITCKKWQNDSEHPDEVWFYPKHFKCYANGSHSMYKAEPKGVIIPGGSDDMPF